MDINDFTVNDYCKFKNFTVVCENFYKHPFLIFKQSNETGYHSIWPYGARTENITNDVKYVLSNIVKHLPNSFNPNLQNNPLGANGSFLKQMNGECANWNHTDCETNDNSIPERWAAVIYIHPFPLINSGTSINSYKNISHKHSHLYTNDEKDLHVRDSNRWFKNIRIGNVFNKLLIYPADSFHSPISSFGYRLDNCRNVNTFFISTI